MRCGQQSIRIGDGQAIFFSGARGYLHNVFIARQIISGLAPRKIRIRKPGHNLPKCSMCMKTATSGFNYDQDREMYTKGHLTFNEHSLTYGNLIIC